MREFLWMLYEGRFYVPLVLDASLALFLGPRCYRDFLYNPRPRLEGEGRKVGDGYT